MFIQQLYTNCLSEAAYYIESEGEAAVIDPLRDIDAYLELAKTRQATIKYIFETHFHADFVSGHLDLAKATGAPIVYGPETEAKFDFVRAEDGQIFPLGKCTITALHTPGHTMESTCWLLKDASGQDHALFTGDTLFIGDVGRPDLSQQTDDRTTEQQAALLYHSLQNKIVPFADHVLVYPAHGPGSACGKNLGPETSSTIGQQKASNYALQQKTEADFVKAVTEGLAEPPAYFPINAQINKEGYEPFDEVVAKALKPLPVAAFKQLIADDEVLVIDTRHASVFTQGFVPGSMFLGLEGRYAEWGGTLVPFDKTLVLVTEEGKEKESAIRLSRVGFSRFGGYLQGGFEAWQKAGENVDMIVDVEADELMMDLPFDPKLLVVDVRKELEYADGHVKGAVHLPLSSLPDPGSMSPLNDDDNMYVHCAGGYRSVIAASLMKRQGYHNLRNVVGGWASIKKQEGLEVEKTAALLN